MFGTIMTCLIIWDKRKGLNGFENGLQYEMRKTASMKKNQKKVSWRFNVRVLASLYVFYQKYELIRF